MTLHYVEKGKHQQALQIFDHHIAPMMKSSGAMLDLVDAASLLQRIEFDGIISLASPSAPCTL